MHFFSGILFWHCRILALSKLRCVQPIGLWRKWLTFCSQCFEIYFWKSYVAFKILMKIFQGFSWQYGIPPNRRQAIKWANGEPSHWHICASSRLSATVIRPHTHRMTLDRISFTIQIVLFILTHHLWGNSHLLPTDITTALRHGWVLTSMLNSGM